LGGEEKKLQGKKEEEMCLSILILEILVFNLEFF
jgi:hypothetical protein